MECIVCDFCKKQFADRKDLTVLSLKYPADQESEVKDICLECLESAIVISESRRIRKRRIRRKKNSPQAQPASV